MSVDTSSIRQVRAMPPELEPQVRKLYAYCHPNWDTPSLYWFHAYPTLVIVEDELVAYSSYSMNTNDDGELVIFLQDTGVTTAARGRGLSRVLMNARLEIGRSMGAKYAAGMTQPDNVPMLKLLASLGFRDVAVVPNVYTNVHPHVDGIVFRLDF